MDKKKKAKVNSPSRSWWKDKTQMSLLGGIILLTIIAFSPIFNAEFVNWDDTVNVYENPYVLNFDVASIFSNPVIGNYNPLTILSFAIDHALVGLDPTWYHTENLILHILNIMLVYGLSFRLNFGKHGSLLIAALFALHPMRVESVAWVTERKDLLFGLFYLTAIHSYLTYKSSQKRYWYLVTMALFILSCLSKIQAVSLPLSLILIDYWLSNEPKWLKFSIEKIPFFIISIITGLVGVYFLGEQGSLMNSDIDVEYNIIGKLCIGFNSLVQYLIKAIVPYEMVAIYPYPKSLSPLLYLSGAIGIGFLGYLIYSLFRPKRPWTFGLLYFFVNVVFVLQFINAGQGYKADRFTYIPYLGLFLVAGYYFQRLYRPSELTFTSNGRPAPWRKILLIGIIIGICIYAFLTHRQTKVWVNNTSLWTHQIAHYPLPLPHTNLANYLRENNKTSQALEHYNKAIALDPNRGLTYNSRGKLFFNTGEYERARADCSRAIALNVENIAEAYSNRGACNGFLNQHQAALADFNKAIELAPKRVVNYINRGALFSQMGNYEKAYQDFEHVLKLEGPSDKTHSQMAKISLQLKQLDRAIQHYSSAISLDANNPTYYLERAYLYSYKGMKQQALSDIQTVQQFGVKIPQELLQRVNNL